MKHVMCLAVIVCGVFVGFGPAQPADLRRDALHTLKRGVDYYRSKIASHGGYVYYYSVDLTQRWGEGAANADTLFVQPPGTPTVGMAYLTAHAATGDMSFLEAARAAAEALVYGQLQSGGWTQTIHFGPAKRVGKYRNGKGGNWNVSSLDDDQTQAALRLLMRVDNALGFGHAAIHEAATFGLAALLQAQFANGGFPQVWVGPAQAKPILKARFPDYDWKTHGRVKNYWDYYTLNDNLAGTVAGTLIEAHQIYKDAKYQTALERLGDFLMLAQMPAPQPGWCQQYNYDMVPIWARKFEPPAISGWESQDVMETLIKISLYTGNKKYLEPLPRALAYFKKCLLPDGQVARFYELETNKPLYTDGRYQLTYDDSAVPGHYGWKHAARFDRIDKAFEDAKKGIAMVSAAHPRAELVPEVRKIVEQLDGEGRWISTYAGERFVGQPRFSVGYRFISSAVFSRNVETLSAYISATK